jgi:hypothetical protein
MAIKPPWGKTSKPQVGDLKIDQDCTISINNGDTWTSVDTSIGLDDKMIPGLTIEKGFVKIGNKAFDAEQLGIMLSYLEELTKEAKPEEFI